MMRWQFQSELMDGREEDFERCGPGVGRNAERPALCSLAQSRLVYKIQVVGVRLWGGRGGVWVAWRMGGGGECRS